MLKPGLLQPPSRRGDGERERDMGWVVVVGGGRSLYCWLSSSSWKGVEPKVGERVLEDARVDSFTGA